MKKSELTQLINEVLNEVAEQTELAKEFVKFLPKDFPETVEKLVPKHISSKDRAYHKLLALYSKRFEKKTGKPIFYNDMDFYDTFEDMMYRKFGNKIQLENKSNNK